MNCKKLITWRSGFIAVFSLVALLSTNVSFGQIPKTATLVETESNGNEIYLERNGIVKWEKWVDGTIIEYYPNGKLKMKVSPTEEIHYGQNGNVVLHKTKEGERIYNDSGELDAYIKDDEVTRYRDGAPIRKKSLSDQSILFETIGDSIAFSYREKDVKVVTDEGKIIRIIQPLRFGYELDTSLVAGEVISATKKDGVVKKGVGGFFAKLFTFEFDFVELQLFYDEEYVSGVDLEG